MDSSNTPKLDGVEGLRTAFKLSADHLHQLLSLVEAEADSPSLGTIERAFAAHRDIAERLAKAVRNQRPLEPKRQVPSKSPSGGIDEQPANTLIQPASHQGRLGPLPRFVPVEHAPAKDAE
ncbi:MAG: hypothetical protein ACPGQS_07795 [Bradymonadia bacterium]